MLSTLRQKLVTKACSVSPVKLVLQQIFLHSSHLRKGALHIPDLSMAAWHNGARQCGGKRLAFQAIQLDNGLRLSTELANRVNLGSNFKFLETGDIQNCQQT